MRTYDIPATSCFKMLYESKGSTFIDALGSVEFCRGNNAKFRSARTFRTQSIALLSSGVTVRVYKYTSTIIIITLRFTDEFGFQTIFYSHVRLH